MHVHSSNYYIPEDRAHLERKLNNLVGDVHEKHEDIMKENEEWFRVLDWINEMSSKSVDFEYVDKEGVTHSERMLNEIEDLEKDNEALRTQLGASRDALGQAGKSNEILRKQIDSFSDIKNKSSRSNTSATSPQSKELDAFKNENKNLEERLDKLQKQNKKKIEEYLESLEDPVDLGQLGRSFRGLTEEYKDTIKQFHEEKKSLINEISDTNDEYAELVKLNFRQKKKKLEIQNEIEALNNLIENNSKLKSDFEDANTTFTDSIRKDISDIDTDIEETQDLLDKAESEDSKIKMEQVQAKTKISKLNQELRKSNDSKDLDQLDDALGKLEKVHDKRIQAGIQVEDDNKVSGGQKNEYLIQIEETIDAPYKSEREKEIDDLQNMIRKVEDEIIDLMDMQNQVQQSKGYIKRKNALSESLHKDIEELKKKVASLSGEIEGMLQDLEVSVTEHEEKKQKSSEQHILIEKFESHIRDLRSKLQEMEGLTIEGFTDEEILELREILDEINKKIESHKNKHRKQDEYYSIRKNELLEKEKYIIDLRRKLRDLGGSDPEAPKFETINIDVENELDRMMLDYIKKWNCNVPITRMGKGYYFFGTRKIYAKILNNKLVIRVGGGYMIITEFLDQYSDVELNKINRLMDKEQVDRYEDIRIVRQNLQPIWDIKAKSLKKRKKSNNRVASPKPAP